MIEMEAKQLTKNIYYTESDRISDRPVLGYIKGEKFSIMIDGGNSKKHVNDYYKALKEKALVKPELCIVTHWHWDHTFGMEALDIKTIAHENTNIELERMKRWKWTEASMEERIKTGEEIEFAHEHIRQEYNDLKDIRVVTSDISFKEKLTIDCGNLTCQCLHFPSAHSDDSVIIYVEEEKVVFLGDIYNNDFYNNNYRDLEKTRALYNKLNDLDFEIAVIGHGEPISKENIQLFLLNFIS